MRFVLDVLTNVLANIVFWVGFGVMAWLGIRISQRKFARFFGITTNRNIAVYVSNLSELRPDLPEEIML
jgi:hypothetical protein